MEAPSATRLVIFAHAALYEAAWRALLADQPDIVVAGALLMPSDLVQFQHPGQPTTVLVDVPPPQLDVVRQLRAHDASAGLLVLVNGYDLEEIIPLLQAGATACTSRNESVGDLARAVIAAGRGELVLPPALAVRALMALARSARAGEGSVEPLSER
jgi:DNA-binding NarL/FixJ family response regulator